MEELNLDELPEIKGDTSTGDDIDLDSLPDMSWESGDGGAETMPDGKTNQWGGNLRNEGRKVLLRRDKAGKVNGYSTTTSTLARDEDGKIAVIPTVVGGQELSPEDAVKHYAETGEHWGKADNEDDAKKMAQAVHEEHQKSYQKGWNDYIHDHWDEMSDEITKDRGVAYEHKKRTSPDKITLMERLANDDIEDELKKRDDAYNSRNIVTWDDWGREQITHPTKRDSATATMDDMAEIAKEAGLADWQVKRIRSESKTPEEMREALRYVAGNRPAKEGAEEQQQTAGWRSVPKTIVNTAGQMAAGFINLVGTALGGVDEEARHAFMADDPMAKKEGETFDSWLGRVGIDEKVKRMAKRNPAVRENLERYFKWEAPIAGKEGMHQEHSVMVQNGREGTGIGNEAIKGAKELRNWLNEKTPVGNSGSAVVDWLEGAASGIAQFAYLGPTMIATSAADSYQQTRSMALESGRSGDDAENAAKGSAVFDGMMTAAFYYAPFRRWMNGKGITPVQTVRNTSFSELSRGAGRFAAKREFLNQGIAAIEAGGIMGAQRAGDTAIQQFASGQDIDLGEITIEGAKGALDGMAIGAIMGAGRIINARIKGAREYERRVRELIKTPDGAKSFTQLYVDATADFLAEFESGGLPTKQQADKAGLPPMSVNERIEYAKLLRSQGITSEMLRRQSKIGTEGTDGATGRGTPPAPPPEPVIDGETGEEVTPDEALARRIQREFPDAPPPKRFNLPQNADGTPQLTPMRWHENGNKDDEWNENVLAYDPETKVTIMQEADGSFSVHNNKGDSDSAPSLNEAVKKAKVLALIDQYTMLDRERKRKVIETEAAKYGKWDTMYYPTMADAADAIDSVIERDGSYYGITNTDILRAPDKADRDAFYISNNGGDGKKHGVAFLILDNIQEVADIPRILAHEHVGHGGPNSEFGGSLNARVDFAENIRAKEFEKFKHDIVDGLRNEIRANDMDSVNRNLGEVFAHYAAANLDKEPSKLDKLVSAVNGAARKLGLRKTYSAADVRTMMAKWKAAGRGEGGVVAGRSDMPERFEFFPVEEQRTTTEVKDETGHGADEAPAQPESGAERPAEPEAPRPAEAGEAPAAAGVVKNENRVIATSESNFIQDLGNDRGTVEESPLSQVEVNESVITQFKLDANSKGVVNPITGKLVKANFGFVVLWQPKEGSPYYKIDPKTKKPVKYVATGRHRVNAAMEQGWESVPSYTFYEKDGWGIERMKGIDAICNILDEKGTEHDYIRYFDIAKPSEADVKSLGLTDRAKGRRAYSIYAYCTDATRNAVSWNNSGESGKITPEQARVIGEAAPKGEHPRNEAIQRTLLKMAQSGARGKLFEMNANAVADELRNTKVKSDGGEMQLDLFDSPETQETLRLIERRGQYRLKKASQLRDLAHVITVAIDNKKALAIKDEWADTVKEFGLTDAADSKQLVAVRDKINERANYWEDAVRLDDADKTAMDAEINAAADARAKKLAELKAKREAAKSGKPAPKPKAETPAPEPAKNEPVSEPPKTEATTPPKAEKPVDGQKSSDTAAPLTGARGAAAKVFPQGTNEAQINQFVESQFMPLSDVASAKLDKDGTLTIVGKSKNGTHKKQRIFKDGSAQGGVVEDGKKSAAPVRESRTTEKPATGQESRQVAKPRQPSIKMKDEAAEKIAQQQEDDLAALFDTRDLSAENENPAVNGALDHHNENAPRAGSDSSQPKVALNRKAKVSQGTAEIVPQPAAEVKRRIQTYRNGDINVRVNDIPTLLRDIGALFKMRYMGRSRYATYEAQIGNILFRLSDHNASGANFRRDTADKYVSVYIDVQTFPHQATPIPFTEIRFSKESYMRNARGVANAIIDGVESLLDTGDFKVDPNIGQKIEYPAEVNFDTQDFDPDVFQKRVGAVAKLVKTYKDSGVADFKTLATRMAERFPDKFDAMKPYLRGVWNAVADQMDLTDVSRGDAEKVYATIEAQAKEAENGPGDNRTDGGVRPAADGEQQPGGLLADGPVREQGGDGRLDGERSGQVPGLGDRLAEKEASGSGEEGKRGTSEQAGAVSDSARPEGGESGNGPDSEADGNNADTRVKKRAKKAADDTKPNPRLTDFAMTKAVEAAILEKNTATRVRNNIAAINLIRDLAKRNYAATPAEQEILAKFVGWGGLREDVFGYDLERAYDMERSGDTEAAERHLKRHGISRPQYALHKELRSVLNDSEYESAKASSSTAFYTPVEFVRIMHDALRGLGVKGGRFLGPSAGTGNFASAAGQYEKPVNWQFVEKDTMTGELLKALFPNQRVTIGGFEETKFPDGFFDFAIDNVPYADVPINDRSISSKMFKIHDYFFAKTLAKLRPGGVMAFLTSTGTLDKTSPILRQYLTEHGGKIVGAVRLPNGFFSENAGTEAASDLVIVQKVDGRPDNSAFEKGVEYATTTEWVRRKGQVKKPLTYNGYFQDHPEQVVGTMEVASGQYGPTLKYAMPEDGMWDKVRTAVQNALAGIDHDALLKSAAVAQQQDHTPIYDEEGLRQGNVTMKDGKAFIKSGEMLEPIELPNDRTLKKELAKRFRSAKSIMDGLMSLRKAMRDVIDAQMAESDTVEADMEPLWAKLNETYDAFVKKNGTLHDKWVTPFVLLDKADGNRMLALERVVKDENGKSKVVKSDIFSKRVISRGQRATKAETPKDALVISYSESGAINVPRIAELLGVNEETAIERLKESGDAFDNPQTGRLEPSWEYLSGRVRAKLAAARAAVEAGEESYRANVEALEKVQPPMVKLEDTEIKFGATWVDPECMADFLRDAFGSEHMRIRLTKNEVTGQWNVEFGHVMNEDPWGETSWTPQEFVERVLNHGSMNHYVTDPVDKKRYLDERRTEGNKLAAEKLHSAFSQFIQSSDKWAGPCFDRYNAVMTDMVEIKLPNNVLPFRASGMSESALGKLFEGGDPNTPKKGREYQSAVISRGVLGGGSLCLAHCVGAGKTLEMQSIGILGRHLGMFKKPMYVVPNHMLEQFTNEFMEAFPNANILKMSEDDVKPENRRAFFAQVANGDWDAIVVKHSTFSKKLGMSDAYQKDFLEAQRKDMEQVIEAMREAGDKISVDKANKMLEKLTEKIDHLANAENHDSQIVPFEELGVDQLFVDEAHNFKGLPITTSQGRTGGLSQGDSQRAVDMQMKAQYVQSLHGGDRGVVFATGTPLSNAPVVEAFVILKYLAPNKLAEQGLSHFDDFVSAFGRITTESEFSLDGKTVKERDKVSAFVNIPEMMKLFRSVVDIVNPDQLDIPRPKPKYRMIDVDMTGVQAQIMEMVAREAAIPPSREDRNKYLTLTRIAKNACLSPRLLGFEDGGNKIIRAVSEIKKMYDETAADRGVQLVFTDIFNMSVSTGSDAFGRLNYAGFTDERPVPAMLAEGTKYNLNEEIRDLLVAAGIPKEEIAIVQDIDKMKGDKDANKGALFAKVRAGDVRVLIGSRPRMGEGTNVQDRLAAIHLLHPGWKPAEDEQAIGRIIRYGNMYKEGQIFYYLTKGNANIGSYETKNHQLIGGKSKLIDQVMHGDETVREIDMDESAMDRDMLMGLASGNKALMELIDVKKRVHKLELNTESTMTSARRNKDKAEANARVLERKREEFAKEQEGVQEWREKNEGKPFTLSTPDGRNIEKVKDMADYIAAQMAKILTQDRYDRNERTVLGNFNGVDLVLAFDKWGDEKFRLAVPLLGVVREINYSGFLPDFTQNTMTAFKGKIFETVSPDYAQSYQNSLADMDRQAKKMAADADKLQKDYEAMRNELIKLRHRQMELERAVTPMIIDAARNREYAIYGNWVITKTNSGYKARQDARIEGEKDKTVEAQTVKELLPLMDQVDFAEPKRANKSTVQLAAAFSRYPELRNAKPEDGVEWQHNISPSQVDFDTPDISPVTGPIEYTVRVTGPLGTKYIPTTAVSMKKAVQNAKFRYAEGNRLIMSDLKGMVVGAYGFPTRYAIMPSDENEAHLRLNIAQKLAGLPITGRNGQVAGRNGANDKGGNGTPGNSNSPDDGGVAVGYGGGVHSASAGTQSADATGGVGHVAGHNSTGAGNSTGGNGRGTQLTFADLGVDFDTPDLSPAEEAYGETEDKTPTEKVMREVYGMTNDEIATAMKAAGMEPPKHVRKPDSTAWQQAEALLSNPSYMAKLSRAVAKFPRNIADYENNALNVLFRQRQNAVNDAQNVVDGLKETLDAFDAIPKEERDTDFTEERSKTAQDYTEAKAKLAQAKALMFETGTALTRSSSEAGRRLRSNRGLLDQTDLTYAGLSGQVAAIVGGGDKITPEMDAKIREIAGEFASLDEQGRDLATARLKAHAEKIVEQIKRGDKVRKMAERQPGDEVKRVMRNYNDALAQIEVGAAEVGGTLVGLSDQQYPAWGKWLRAIGEYHCFENPDITEEECIKAIVEDISPFMDGVDENQVRDALTGFGHNFRQSRYEAQRHMNDLRSQSRLKRQLDWMDETNTMPPLTGLVRDEPSDTTRNLQKQVQERKAEVPDSGRDERRLKGILDTIKTRTRNRIADLENAIATGEKIPGRERTVPEDIELRELRKRRDELQKAYDELFKTESGMTDEQRVKLAERLLAKNLEHALADLDRARSGDFSKRPKRPGVESPTLDVLREKIADTRREIRELKKAKYEFGMTPEELEAYNARKIANREKAIARLAERIVSGDIRPQKKPQPPMSEEMQKRYDELAEQMNRAHRKLNDLRREAADARKPKFVRFIGDAYRFVDGVWKMATASLDFTQVGNQTGTILMAHPKLVAENFAKTLKAFTSTTNAENIELDLLSDASVKEAVDNGWLHWKKISDSSNRGERVELFDAIDKPFTIGGKAIRFTDIPGYGTLIANSDRLYATYINAASASLYSSIINDPKLFPGGASVFQKKMLCDMINVMNGSGSLSKDNRRMLGKVFWAPGLVDSQLKRLIGYQVWHPWTASAEEDGSGTFKERLAMSKIGLGEFVKANLGALLLGSLIMSLFSTDDQKDEFAHAGIVQKIQMLVAPRVRHTQLDFTGGSVAFLRLGRRLATGAYETSKGKQAKVRDTFSEVAHFAKGRLTPLVSNAFSAMSGKDYTGQDYGAAELLLSFAPISLRDAGKSIYENGIEDRAWGTAFLGAGLTMFGIGKGTYRKDDYAILSNRFLESKKEFDAIESDDLIDEGNKKLMLDSIVSENPLMRDEVRDEIAADIARIRKDEAKARKDEKEGNEPDADLLSEIETGKAKLLEKIRAARRK